MYNRQYKVMHDVVYNIYNKYVQLFQGHEKTSNILSA